MRRSIVILLALAFGLTLAAGAVSAAGPGGAVPSAKRQPPAKQIKSLKRQVRALKQQVARLKAQNRRLEARVAALSPQGITRQLAETKTALDKYQSVEQARADGYAQASPCESSPQGAMGFHFMSGAAMADGRLDPERPEVLLYAPSPTGLQLVGAEYLKPDADQDLSTDEDRPTLFGRAFDGPMLGHAPGMPKHYDLHVWLWKRNPTGMFAQWNPDVRCG